MGLRGYCNPSCYGHKIGNTKYKLDKCKRWQMQNRGYTKPKYPNFAENFVVYKGNERLLF